MYSPLLLFEFRRLIHITLIMIYFFFLVGPEKFKTKVINNTVNPEWNEVFEVSKEDR